MNIRTRPLIVAAALALGVSAPAFGQAAGGDSGGNTNSLTAPAPLAPVNPVTSGNGSPVMRGSVADDTYAPTVATPVPAPEVGRIDDDANEHAARAARSSDEEEHGGVRNGWHGKKDRARARVGMKPDND